MSDDAHREPDPDAQPAGVPARSKLPTVTLLVAGLVDFCALLVAGMSFAVGKADLDRAEEQCKGDVETVAVHLGRGDLDLAEQRLSWLKPECTAAHVARVGELRRAIAATKLEVTTTGDATAADAARELEAVESWPTRSATVRKNLKEAAAFVARGDLEHAAPLVTQARWSLDRVKSTSVGKSAAWAELDALDEQLRAKVKPYMDQVQAELAEAQRRLKAAPP